jgi:hypothetical protein
MNEFEQIWIMKETIWIMTDNFHYVIVQVIWIIEQFKQYGLC